MPIIEAKWGKAPMSIFKMENRQRTKGAFKAWRDELAAKSPRQADYLMVILGKVCSVAEDRGLIPFNPCTNMGTTYVANRAHIIWDQDDLVDFIAQAPHALKLPVMVARYTGQREGDIIRMRYQKGDSDQPYYDGTHIYVRQGKTGAFVRVRAVAELKAVLDAEVAKIEALEPDQRAKRKGLLCVTDKNGKPWANGYSFSGRFGKIRDVITRADGSTGVRTDDGRTKTFHDLRGTAITWLARAGCSAIQIAAITGHDITYVNEILAAHYLDDRPELAEQGISKLEAYMEAQKGKAAAA